MTNPNPSLHRCLVLHQIYDGEVWWANGFWWARGSHRDHKVSGAVDWLFLHSYIRINQVNGVKSVELMADGHEVIRRRPLHDLLEALNRR